MVKKQQRTGKKSDRIKPQVKPQVKEEPDENIIVSPVPEDLFSSCCLEVQQDIGKTCMGADAIHSLGKPEHVLFDIKYTLPKDSVDGRL